MVERRETKLVRLFRLFHMSRAKKEKASDSLANSTLQRLYELVETQGVLRFTLSKGLSIDSKPVLHKDLVLKTDETNKRYIISVIPDGKDSTLGIADFRVQEGIERALLFRGASCEVALKVQKNGPIRVYELGQTELSQEEQVAFLNEVAKAQVDLETTQELSKKDLTF